MEIFEKFNSYKPCPICGTIKDGKAVLIGIDGTVEGNIEEAMQVHLDCINLRVQKDEDATSTGHHTHAIYQFYTERK